MTSFETWYLTKEKLPENDAKVLCVTKTKSGVFNIVLGYYADGRWCCGMNSNVIAWAPLISVYLAVIDKLSDMDMLEEVLK